MLLKIDFAEAAGIAPALNAFSLPAFAAQVADNCRFDRGDVRPWNAPAAVAGVTLGKSSGGEVRSLYRFGQTLDSETQHWLQFLQPVNVVKGPIAGDANERTYWTGQGAPKMGDATLLTSGSGSTLPNNHMTLGIPRPQAAPTVTISGTGTGTAQAVAYFYTYVSARGEEGAPSPIVLASSVQVGQTVDVGVPETVPAVSGQFDITKKRIYAAYSSPDSDTATWFYKGEVMVALTSFTDTEPLVPGARVLEARHYDMPPANLHSLTSLANGVMAGWSGNDFCLCEPYLPHAWPVKYMLASDSPGVGIGVIGQAFVALTTGKPYLVPMTHPASASMQPIDFPQACVARQSIVSVPGGVAYASPDGYCFIGPSGGRVITAGGFSREQWQAFAPESIHAYLHDGKIVAFYDNGSEQGGFVLDPNNARAPFSPLSFHATAGYADPKNDALYLVIAGVLHKFDAGTPLTLTWRSKRFQMPRPMTPGWAKVQADAYPVTFRYFANGVLKHSKTVTSDEPFRLPAGFQAKDIEMEMECAQPVRSMAVATSMEELRNVS